MGICQTAWQNRCVIGDIGRADLVSPLASMTRNDEVVGKSTRAAGAPFARQRPGRSLGVHDTLLHSLEAFLFIHRVLCHSFRVLARAGACRMNESAPRLK